MQPGTCARSELLSGDLDTESVEEHLTVLGDEVFVLHGFESIDSGGDVDCAVHHIDPLWPLRFGRGWSLCQCLRYDLTGRTWILVRDGSSLEVDSLEDPVGIGRYGFPTSLILAGSADSASAIRAAYLAAKRLRKGERSEQSWKAIEDLARTDADAFGNALAAIVGERVGSAMASGIGRVPATTLWKQARTAQLVRRFRTPGRMAIAARSAVGRVAERVSKPTGLLVIVVGPDGTGKSTLCGSLEDACKPLFRGHRRYHWRPGLLPRPGGLLGREMSDSTRPHDSHSRGRLLSSLFIAYYWLDFFLGGWTRIWPLKLRSTLVVVERGWKDVLVDPKRYGFRTVWKTLLDAGERLLPTADIVFVLEGPPEAIAVRKKELPPDEVARQGKAWREVLQRDTRAVFLDATEEQYVVVQKARESIVDFLEKRSISRLGSGWARLTSTNGDWLLPRGPSSLAARGLKIHQPMTPRGRVAWEAARLGARCGAFGCLRRAEGPRREVLDLLMPHVPKRGTFSLGKSNHPGRYVALILGPDGESRAFAKMALEESGKRALFREGERIRAAGGRFPPPLMSPRVIGQAEGLLVFEPVEWRPRTFPWVLPSEVASALGELFRSGSGGAAQSQGWAHGDCAPWNLLREGRNWVLVDWEEARDDAPPFYDVFHYIVQAHSLLGRPSQSAVLEAIDGRGPLGGVIRAYSESAEVDLEMTQDEFPSYLRTSQMLLDSAKPDGRAAIRARQKLLRSRWD